MEDYKIKKEKVLVTGAAGFIGYHLSKRLLKENFEVIGLDNLNSYYDVSLKYARLKELGVDSNLIQENKIVCSNNFDFKFIKLDLCDIENLLQLFKANNIVYVCNLAAQAGVRYSIENPFIYVQSNVNGFLNILECCRSFNVKNLVYASTSSVYGLNTEMPLHEEQTTAHPMTLYAATKKANEVMAHSYSHLYKIPTIGLRFFTVYGPYGRPDMALFKFTKSILESKEIEVYNGGNMVRDFTYIDDIVNGIFLAVINPPNSNSNWNDNPLISESSAPFKLYNIGNNDPVKLIDYIRELERCLNRKAKIKLLPMQLGDVPKTWANIEKIKKIGYSPQFSYKKGIKNFVDWYLNFYKN